MMLVCHESAVMPTTLDEQRSTPLRIAAYGFVDKHAGSQVSASFVALERLLQNGHEVVFYAVKGFVEPRELFCYPNFRYVGIRLEKMEWGWRAIDAIFKGDLREDVRRCYSQFTVPAHRSVIRKRMRADHRARPFDAIVTFGVLSPFRLSGVATISWTQGLPHGE